MPEIKNLQKMLQKLSGNRLLIPGRDLEMSLPRLTSTSFCTSSQGGQQSEGKFVCSDGYEVPIESKYRYGINRFPDYLPYMRFMRQLLDYEDLDKADKAEIIACIGTRTPSLDFAERENLAIRLREKYPTLVFTSSSVSDWHIQMSDEQIKNRLRQQVRWNSDLFNLVSNFGNVVVPDGGELLEVGFTSGGWSQFAFEKLGYQVMGVDNAYGDVAERPCLHDHLASRISSKVEFCFADITAQNALPAGSFDVVVTVSVLEHIQNLPAAIREMRRLLKPNGVMIHRYDPFFHQGGGHAWGTLDSPWAHVLMSKEDRLRYIKELRPNESDIAVDWNTGTLSDQISLSRMQRLFVEEGLSVAMWREEPISIEQQQECTSDIVARAMEIHPHIGFGDLMTREVIIAAYAR